MDADPCSNMGRGYYSEMIVSEEEEPELIQGAYKRTKLLWQIRTDTHSPIIPTITCTTKPNALAPAKRWTYFPEEKRIVSFKVLSLKI